MRQRALISTCISRGCWACTGPRSQRNGNFVLTEESLASSVARFPSLLCSGWFDLRSLEEIDMEARLASVNLWRCALRPRRVVSQIQ